MLPPQTRGRGYADRQTLHDPESNCELHPRKSVATQPLPLRMRLGPPSHQKSVNHLLHDLYAITAVCESAAKYTWFQELHTKLQAIWTCCRIQEARVNAFRTTERPFSLQSSTVEQASMFLRPPVSAVPAGCDLKFPRIAV